MQLIRILQIDLHTNLPNELTFEFFPINGIFPKFLASTRTVDSNIEKSILYIYTQYKIDGELQLKDDGTIQIERDILRLLEEPVELLGRMLGVNYQCEWKIYSVGPHMAFVPESQKEYEWLKNSNGLSGLQLNNSIETQIDTDKISAELLKDRLDGLYLISEALLHKHATGKYHEIVRLFEAAFKLPFSQLEKKLTQFLNTGGMGYKRDEIREWVTLRHGATHADGKKTNFLVMESDIITVIDRMIQAAYDVFFNKAEWGNNSSTRRDGISFKSMTVSKFTGEAIKGTKSKAIVEIRDPFGSYRCDPAILKPELMPNNWWYKVQDSSAKMSINVH